MKKPAIALLTITALLLCNPAARAESALFGWQAVAGPTDRLPVTWGVVMDGPSQMNKVPDKEGVFRGHYLFKPGWETTLKAVHLVSYDQASGIMTRPIKFKLLGTTDDRDPQLKKTEFETESIKFKERDTFALVFETKSGTEMVFIRISPKFIPS